MLGKVIMIGISEERSFHRCYLSSSEVSPKSKVVMQYQELVEQAPWEQ